MIHPSRSLKCKYAKVLCEYMNETNCRVFCKQCATKFTNAPFGSSFIYNWTWYIYGCLVGFSSETLLPTFTAYVCMQHSLLAFFFIIILYSWACVFLWERKRRSEWYVVWVRYNVIHFISSSYSDESGNNNQQSNKWKLNPRAQNKTKWN